MDAVQDWNIWDHHIFQNSFQEDIREEELCFSPQRLRCYHTPSYWLHQYSSQQNILQRSILHVLGVNIWQIFPGFNSALLFILHRHADFFFKEIRFTSMKHSTKFPYFVSNIEKTTKYLWLVTLTVNHIWNKKKKSFSSCTIPVHCSWCWKTMLMQSTTAGQPQWGNKFLGLKFKVFESG